MGQLVLPIRALLLSVTLLLPGGCMTAALWHTDQGEELRWIESDETEFAVGWQLVPGRHFSLKVAARGGVDREACSEWTLTPRDGGDIALALLQDSELLPTPTLRVIVQRDWERGDLKYTDAEVELTGALVLSQIGRPIDVATLPDESRAAHEAARGVPRYAFAAATSTTGGDLLERCERRLASLTLHHLSPTPTVAMTMVGATFVDAAGAPFQLPPPPNDRPRTFAEEFALLRGVRAIVAATDGHTQHTFELRMDRAWLWAASSRQPDGQLRYTSDWTFQPIRTGTVADAPTQPPSDHLASLRVVDHIYEWQEEQLTWGEFASRLAVTPFTLVGDALIGWVFAAFDGDDEDTRRSEAEREAELELKRKRTRGKRR